jgi:hypothetical protein
VKVSRLVNKKPFSKQFPCGTFLMEILVREFYDETSRRMAVGFREGIFSRAQKQPTDRRNSRLIDERMKFNDVLAGLASLWLSSRWSSTLRNGANPAGRFGREALENKSRSHR